MAAGSRPGVQRLRVNYPNRDPETVEMPAGMTLEAFRAALQMQPHQALMASHSSFPERMYKVEHSEQLSLTEELFVVVPKRRIFINVLPDIKKKAVLWYEGATLEQIERAIAKAAGFPPDALIELLEGDACLVLSESIPNDTEVEVVAFQEARASFRSMHGLRPRPEPASASLTLPLQPSRPEAQSFRRAATTSNMQTSSSYTGTGSQSFLTGAATAQSSSVRPLSPMSARRASISRAATSPLPNRNFSAPEEHCIHILAGHTGCIFCLCAVGDILFTGAQDNNIMIWDLNNLQYIGTLPGHRGFVKCLCASFAKKILCSGSQDRTVRVWSLETFSTVKTLYGHTASVNAVMILENLDVLVTGSEDRSIRVWDITTYEVMINIEQAHLGGIFALEKFGSPTKVISGARDRSLKVWDCSSWTSLKQLHPPHYDGVTSIAVTEKHGKFYSGSRDRSIKEWDFTGLNNSMHTLHVHGDWVQALCISPSQDILFSGSRDSVIKVWDEELQCQDVLQGHRGPVSGLTAVGERLFSASHDRTVRIWRVDQYF